jgi:hypothetical protein
MLKITHKTLTLEPQEVMELERIIIDEDREGAFQFLKKNIYQQFTLSQESRLKSHLDGCNDPVSTFSNKK